VLVLNNYSGLQAPTAECLQGLLSFDMLFSLRSYLQGLGETKSGVQLQTYAYQYQSRRTYHTSWLRTLTNSGL